MKQVFSPIFHIKTTQETSILYGMRVNIYNNAVGSTCFHS